MSEKGSNEEFEGSPFASVKYPLFPIKLTTKKAMSMDLASMCPNTGWFEYKLVKCDDVVTYP